MRLIGSENGVAKGLFSAVLFLFGLASFYLSGIDDMRTDDINQNEIVTTGAGQSTANVTLDRDLYLDEITHVTAIPSNITGEVPLPTNYTESSNLLEISSLNTDTTRALTISYAADVQDEWMVMIGPFLALLLFGGLIFAIIKGGFFSGRGRR